MRPPTTLGLCALLVTLSALAPLAAQEAADVAIPDPVVPVYDTLKPLHLTTALVTAGQAAATIVAPPAYQAQGEAISDAVADITGVPLLVVSDDAPEAVIPPLSHLICLGNRSTNRAISALYDRGYTFLDLKYPGAGGHVVNSLHSPFGDGHNVVFVGGSDAAGVEAATQALVRLLRRAGGGAGELAVGWLQDIALGPAYKVEHDVKKVEIWEASRMYGSSGYFGWNMLSKHLALYYQTGDETHLREFMRLAFPDPAAIREIEDYDGERIENKHSPLSGPYHYAAHMMILLWDLVEESPFFSDADRLRITNAFAAQLPHRVAEGVYGRTAPPGYVGDRHGDWAATSLYVLGRYFQKDYPGPVWQRCMTAAEQYYQALANTYWMAAYNDHLFWFTSYYDPMFDYLLLSGDRVGLDNGNIRRALRTQEILFQGLDKDPGTNASALSMLNKAAYLLGDGRWLWFRERCGLDTDAFRLGQSFWPGPDLAPTPPADLVGAWTLQMMPEGMWQARGKVFPLEQSFKWGSYRSSLDATGDYLMLDGYNGGGRNPYHTFDLLNLRLDGVTLLDGYHNQVLTSADAMVEPRVAMDSALLYRDVVGDVAFAVGEVPGTPFATWRRTIALRHERYALIVDDLTFRTQSDNMKVETEWDPRGGVWDERRRVLRWRAEKLGETPPGWFSFPALAADCACGPGTADEMLSRLDELGIVLLKAKGVGAFIEMPLELAEPLRGEVYADLMNYTDRGIFRLSLDGGPPGEPVDLYGPAVATTRLSLGEHDLAAGAHRLRVEAVGRRPQSTGHYLGLIGVQVRPAGAAVVAPATDFELRSSLPLKVAPGGSPMVWEGPVTPGMRQCVFHLIATNDTGRDDALACLQVAPNVAALQLPEPALAVAGEYEGIAGDLVVVGESGLTGHGIRQIGAQTPLLAADRPVAANWDFARGTLTLVTEAPTTITLALAGPAQLDGKAVGPDLQLPAGQHVVESARPAATALQPLVEGLPAAIAAAEEQYMRGLQGLAHEAVVTAPEVPPLFATQLAGRPGRGVTMDTDEGPAVCLPVGKSVQLVDASGQVVRTLATDAEVKCLHWWSEAGLLLVGCLDEQVIAFDAQGERRWAFTSEMDQAVWEAGKQYWFKAAYPGVHGLGSGDLGAGPVAFVGSACTLEFLDPGGGLVKRIPVFWGPGRHFLVTDKPGGGKQLLQARWHNDGVQMAIIDGATLIQTGSGFVEVPPGHTFVTGWDCMNREDNFYTDLDGDGQKEVVSAINGTWNRVSVWDSAGKPLANAQFGPGVTEPRANLRQMGVGDINADGVQEILVATAQGIVVALSPRCEKVWAARLPSRPTVLRVVGGEVCVGCEAGQVFWLDRSGHIVRQATVSGKPVDLQVVARAGRIVVATDAGTVVGFAAGG